MRSSTITLYIDTSSSCLYAGVVKEHELLAEVQESLGKDLSTYALSKIEKMLKEVELTPSDIDRIIVVNGPGSFTGIRIGITIAKTYAWALKKDIVTINSLEAMAISTNTNTFKVPVIDARRGYVFAGIYNQNNQVVLKNQYIQLETLKTAADTMQEPYQFITNDTLEIETVAYHPDILKIVEFCEEKPVMNPHSVNPEYLKRTEAEETKGIITE